ncbi:hypothetical protein RJ639_012403 [Escallonia herrerae]|uniref:Uncharacterized protein n=1 Tax=Escallonia herrerae TaxID=1293975 RepID=A0AA88VQS5_9ASTE|nr:hypothetical protein RJ639_026570 [Escallonia herrerae]KAK3012048.1 hypothetical protein RJ639_012403 [Escallonia herrerae]
MSGDERAAVEEAEAEEERVIGMGSYGGKGTPGVTGAVMWDSGVVLGKFLEHAVEVGMIGLQGKKVVELGSGCGLVGEGAVMDLLTTLEQLCGTHTTLILAGELRNGMSFDFSSCMYIQRSKDCVRVADAILEYFLEAAMKEFSVGRIDQAQWHPDYCSARVVIYVMVKKSRENEDLVY